MVSAIVNFPFKHEKQEIIHSKNNLVSHAKMKVITVGKTACVFKSERLMLFSLVAEINVCNTY